MTDGLASLFDDLAAVEKQIVMPGFSVGVWPQPDAQPIYYNYGTWSGEGNNTVTADTVYDLASVSKLYTAALILDLYQDDRLDIDASCATYLDVFRGSNVTVHDLLTHKADFKTGFGAIREQHGADIHAAIFSITPPVDASPNRTYQNATYSYLGRIAEIVTGHTLTDLFMQFFDRYDLAATYPGQVGQTRFQAPPTERLPNGDVVQNVTHDETARLLGGVAGHAGVFATNRDVIAFGRLWLNGRLIRNDGLFRRVFRNYSADTDFAQGLGWQNRPSYLDKYIPTIFHQPGFTGCSLIVNTATKTVASILCNRVLAGRDNADHKKLRHAVFNYIAKELA